MATLQTRATARLMMSPAVILLFLWMIVPLVMTLYFSFLRYNLLDARNRGIYRLSQLSVLSH